MFCKNCGSILPEKANFCHVCGEKIDGAIPPVIEENKEEEERTTPQFKSIFSESTTNVNKEYRSYLDDFHTLRKEDEHTAIVAIRQRKAFVPSLLGVIFSLAISFHAAVTYFFAMAQNNSAYKSGVTTYYQYLKQAQDTYTTTGFFLVIAGILGGILGSIGLIRNRNNKHKATTVLGVIAICVAVIAIVVSIFVNVQNNQIKAMLK